MSFAEKDSKGNVISDTYATTKDVAKQSGITIGTILPFLMTKIPAGWLSLESGQEVERNVYPELWAWVQENAPILTEENWQAASKLQTSVGYYSSGDGSTTFRLPKIVDYIRGGLTTDVGTWQSDMFRLHSHEYNTASTPVGLSGGSNLVGGNMARNTTETGGDETRPKTIRMVYCVKAFGTAANQGTIDIQALADDLAYRGIEVGAIMPFLSKTVPAGWLSLEAGQEISRTVYKDLWNWVQTNAPVISETDWQAKAKSQTSVGYYSTGDGTTTFRLPKIVDYIRGGLTTDVGTWQSDAIRNITGAIIAPQETSAATLAAQNKSVIYTTGINTGVNFASTSTANSVQLAQLHLDISRQVPTADENLPKTIRMVYCVKAFSTVVNPGKIEAQTLADSKADINFSNIDTNGKKTIANLAMPGDTFIALSQYPKTGESLTAPANGFYSYKCSCSNVDAVVDLYNITNGLIDRRCGAEIGATSSRLNLAGFIPVKKGDKIQVSFQMITFFDFRFVYAEGEI